MSSYPGMKSKFIFRSFYRPQLGPYVIGNVYIEVIVKNLSRSYYASRFYFHGNTIGRIYIHMCICVYIYMHTYMYISVYIPYINTVSTPLRKDTGVFESIGRFIIVLLD